MTEWLVRSYAPNFCDGFVPTVVKVLSCDDILKVPFIAQWNDKQFKNCGYIFDRFEIKPHGSEEWSEHIIVVYYSKAPNSKDGEHWVTGFCTPVGSLISKDWRYLETDKNHIDRRSDMDILKGLS